MAKDRDTVTHPNTNWAQRRLTSLIEINALPLRQTNVWACLKQCTMHTSLVRYKRLLGLVGSYRSYVAHFR